MPIGIRILVPKNKLDLYVALTATIKKNTVYRFIIKFMVSRFIFVDI
jgi:hypothetical protein